MTILQHFSLKHFHFSLWHVSTWKQRHYTRICRGSGERPICVHKIANCLRSFCSMTEEHYTQLVARWSILVYNCSIRCIRSNPSVCLLHNIWTGKRERAREREGGGIKVRCSFSHLKKKKHVPYWQCKDKFWPTLPTQHKFRLVKNCAWRESNRNPTEPL